MEQQKRGNCELRLLVMKILLLTALFCTFFLLLSIYNPQILRLSRTSGVTMLTYAILLPMLTSVYHSFEIGRQETIHIVNTMTISTWLTDVIIYFQLLIMNFNEDNRSSLMPVPGEVICLIIAMLVQLGLIVLFTHMATRTFHRFNPPKRSCLICMDEPDAEYIRVKLSSAHKRFNIERTLICSRDNLKREIKKYEQVFLYNLPYQERQSLIEYCYKLAKPVSYNMEIADIIGYGAGHDIFEDVSFISAVNRRGLSVEQRIVKRVLDIVVSSLMIVFTSPIMLICAIAIWCGDHDSVFFCQPRATRGGRVFTIYKFRTMYSNADGNRSVRTDDDRITPVGRILRRYRLDELPQLFNILKGDMSLVGPRPEILSNVKSYTEAVPEFSYRLAVKAGLTGYAQIAGKYNTAPKDKMLMDLMYIEDYSIWRDIKLLLQTVTVLFRKESTQAFEAAHEKPEAPAQTDPEQPAV